MNLFAFPSLVAATISAVVGGIALFQKPKSRLNRSFFILNMIFSWVLFTEFGMLLAESYSSAKFWANASLIWYFLLPVELHFILIFTGKRQLLTNKLIYILIYGPPSLFLTGHLFGNVEIEIIHYYWGWIIDYTIVTNLDSMLALWIVLLSISTLLISYDYYRKATRKIHRKQALFVLLGICISIFLGYITLLISPLFNVNIPELDSIGLVVESTLIGYAMWKYDLFAVTATTAADNILATMDDCVILANTDGIIMKTNDATEKILGFTESDLIDQSVSKLFFNNPLRTNSALERVFNEHIDTIRNLEIEFIDRNGDSVPLSLSISVMRDAAGDRTGMVLVGRDLTEKQRHEQEQRRLELQLQQAQKMETVGQMAGGIAHDFNNKLCGIIGYAERGLKNLSDDTRLLRYFHGIIDCSEEAAKLVQQLLAFSRKQILQRKTIDLNQVINDAKIIIGKAISENIDIKTSLSDKIGLISGDTNAINQILTNLYLNAADALPDGGDIIIMTEPISVDLAYCQLREGLVPGDYIILSIADTGHGMDEETQKKIFEPFFTTKEVGKGSGLGLSMVYGLVKQHDGYIECESALGQGTTFRVYFPVNS